MTCWLHTGPAGSLPIPQKVSERVDAFPQRFSMPSVFIMDLANHTGSKLWFRRARCILLYSKVMAPGNLWLSIQGLHLLRFPFSAVNDLTTLPPPKFLTLALVPFLTILSTTTLPHFRHPVLHPASAAAGAPSSTTGPAVGEAGSRRGEEYPPRPAPSPAGNGFVLLVEDLLRMDPVLPVMLSSDQLASWGLLGGTKILAVPGNR